MPAISTKDGTQIYYKDWGSGQPVVFSHGWPLSSDALEDQMFFLASRGYRCIAHDRRGHGRSSQTWGGNDMDTYADDLATLVEALDLNKAIHVGHSTGGGEVARYIGRHGTKRVAKAVLIGAVPPLMLKTPANPGGLPIETFDQIRAGVLADRSQFFKDLSNAVLWLQSAGCENIGRTTRIILAAGNDGRVPRRLIFASRRSPRRTSRKTSRRSTCRHLSCTAMTTRSCRSAPRPCSRPRSSRAPRLKSIRARRTACARPIRTRSMRIYSHSSRLEEIHVTI